VAAGLYQVHVGLVLQAAAGLALGAGLGPGPGAGLELGVTKGVRLGVVACATVWWNVVRGYCGNGEWWVGTRNRNGSGGQSWVSCV
jgi:hypothetical protein